MKRSILPLFLMLSPAPLFAQAAPHGTYFTAPYGPGGTWNLYRTNNAPMTWTQAQTNAEATVDPLGNSGKPGHLVTIGSAAENMFVYQKVVGDYIWIGLTDNEKWGGKEAGSDRSGGWHWVTGEPCTFSAWRSTEPNEYVIGGEDGVVIERSGRWSDWPIGSQGQEVQRHPSMTEWETRSPQPVPGAIQILPILPKKWPADISTWTATGKGPWSIISAVGIDAGGLEKVVKSLQDTMLLDQTCHRAAKLNYHVSREKFFAGGWVAITDHPEFPLLEGGSGALHVAKVRLEKAGTWSFNIHCDDFVAMRFPGHPWKSATGLGGIDPQDPEVIFYACESGDGCIVGTIDLPAGESTIEVVLGNRVYDGMLQILAAPGEFTMDGGTDQWRFPGHKAAGDLAWPGVDSAGWTITRTDRPAGAAPLAKLMDGLVLAESGTGKSAEGVAKLNHIDSGAASDVEFPDPLEFPGDSPGGQDQFVVKATANLVIPRDGVYHIGIHADDHCALRIIGQSWSRFVRDTSYRGKLEGDTIYGEDPLNIGTNVQLFGEVTLKKGTYKMEALYVNLLGPSIFSVFGAPADFAPRLLAKDGAKIEPDIDGLPLIDPAK
ncbi:MAG: lectin-like protein [Luteolibacter sp.]|uniref:lectin-like protein n=1 Tax=Luteolibacter sp. TaxID=1962973 RepID=UPI003265B653